MLGQDEVMSLRFQRFVLTKMRHCYEYAKNPEPKRCALDSNVLLQNPKPILSTAHY